ncbi:MAG: SOUL family heme-binding protein [Bacteriovoracia bacterium]
MRNLSPQVLILGVLMSLLSAGCSVFGIGSEERVVAVLTFSGFWNEEKIREKGAELSAWLAKHPGFEISSAPMFAGYNPPWTLPFLRTNEVLIELKAK